jgi:hypothetical protein
MVWSYSEKTARSTYGLTTNMTVPAAYRSSLSVERNRATTEDDTINYADYRLTLSEWRSFSHKKPQPQIKIRITDNPTDMNDEWALNNYGIMSPRKASENPMESSTITSSSGRTPSTGKIYGKRWEVKATGGATATGGWDEITGNRRVALYNNSTYSAHWDFGVSTDGSRTPFEVYPNRNIGTTNSNTISMDEMNNMFGWFGETQPNHHFGKCSSASADDYSFATKHCTTTNLYPHSFNNGQGRYVQWFVK